MSWWRIIPGLLRPAKELIEVFEPAGPREARGGRAERRALSAQERAALQQVAVAFQARTARTRWDSFIDGLNRVPRPLITLGALACLVLAPLDPLRFAQIARAYQLMPDGFWALLGVIVAFYFGGRMQLKRQDMAVRDRALAIAREVVALQRAVRKHDTAAPSPKGNGPNGVPSSAARGNRVVEAWKRQRAPAAGD